jgi:flagellar FliL protein
MAETTEETSDDTPDDTPDNEEVGRLKKSGIMTAVKALAFISVIVLLEVAGASMFLPSASETAETAERLAAADAAQDVGKDGLATGDGSEADLLALQDMREVSLGSYHVLTYNPETGSSLNVDFELYGTVLEEEEGDFFQLYEANQIRIREQIIVTIRGTAVTDLTEAGLGLIKRKILEKTNRALGKPLLHEAIFSKFSFIER